jgi:hypothetical protein
MSRLLLHRAHVTLFLQPMQDECVAAASQRPLNRAAALLDVHALASHHQFELAPHRPRSGDERVQLAQLG